MRSVSHSLEQEVFTPDRFQTLLHFGPSHVDGVQRQRAVGSASGAAHQLVRGLDRHLQAAHLQRKQNAFLSWLSISRTLLARP